MATSRPPTPEEIEKWKQQIERDSRKEMERAIIGIDPALPDPMSNIIKPNPSGSVPRPGSGPANPAHVPNAARSGLRIWDKDQFDRDIGSDTELYLEGLDIANDTVYIETRPLQSIYKMSCSDATQRGMGKMSPRHYFTLRECQDPSFYGRSVCNISHDVVIFDDVIPVPAECCHVLHQGGTLCKQLIGRPVDWPPGHTWVSLDHCRHVAEGQHSGITCEACALQVWEMRRQNKL